MYVCIVLLTFLVALLTSRYMLEFHGFRCSEGAGTLSTSERIQSRANYITLINIRCPNDHMNGNLEYNFSIGGVTSLIDCSDFVSYEIVKNISSSP